jgi:hypothetical protein
MPVIPEKPGLGQKATFDWSNQHNGCIAWISKRCQISGPIVGHPEVIDLLFRFTKNRLCTRPHPSPDQPYKSWHTLSGT